MAGVLPDILRPGLRVVFCGTAAGTASARAGAYYAGPGNAFWATLHSTGLTPTRLSPAEFEQLPDFGIGLTDICKVLHGSDQEVGTGEFDVAGLEARITAVEPGNLAFNGKSAASTMGLSRSASAALRSGSCRRRPVRPEGTGMSGLGASWHGLAREAEGRMAPVKVGRCRRIQLAKIQWATARHLVAQSHPKPLETTSNRRSGPLMRAPATRANHPDRSEALKIVVSWVRFPPSPFAFCPARGRVFGPSALTTKKRCLGSVWATTRLAVARCEAVIGEITELDSCQEVELTRPRFPIPESRSSLFERQAVLTVGGKRLRLLESRVQFVDLSRRCCSDEGSRPVWEQALSRSST
jgi:TDG/mug DNA glycosylase family protein